MICSVLDTQGAGKNLVILQEAPMYRILPESGMKLRWSLPRNHDIFLVSFISVLAVDFLVNKHPHEILM